MFLIERLIGVSAYCLALLVTWLLLEYTTANQRTVLRIYLVVLAVMAFLYEPYHTADLYRVNEMMEQFATYDFATFFQELVAPSSVPTARVLYWIIGKTGIYGLLPALVTVICYGCVFYILNKTSELYYIGREHIATALLFFMATGNYMMVVSNVRTMLCFALIAVCYFRETVEKKFTFFHILLYLFAVTTHTLGVVVVALRLLCPLFNKELPTWRRAIYPLGVLMGGMVMLLFFGKNMVTLVASVTDKFSEYMFGDAYSYFWEYAIDAVLLLLELVTLYYFRRVRTDVQRNVSNMSHLLVLCLLPAVAFCFEFSTFHRLVSMLVPLITLPVMAVATSEGARVRFGVYRIHLRAIIQIVSLVLLVLSCARGSLCSFKFFTL
ncbi:MAG: EpsG family protein [Clostridia bacterium]|nr:EpsG family protein [Clostridia bacterium]